MRESRRAGFTLVELVVVIGIILILVSLLSVGVFRALTYAKQVKNAHEINDNLSPALEAFKVQYAFYPPSRIRLCKRITSYNAGMFGAATPTLDTDSINWITRMFPRINAPSTDPAQNNFWTNNDILWTGATFTDGTILEGDQCLVFFLGGIPIQATTGADTVLSCSGFSTSPVNPIPTTGGSIVKFYDFPRDRLRDLHQVTTATGSETAGTGSGFWSFLDTYGKMPYAYFSSYKSENGYNRYFTELGSTSDCMTLSAISPGAQAPWPFALAQATASTPTQFYEATRFQIVSAGRDGSFGPGTDMTMGTPFFWTPGNAKAYSDKFKATGAQDDQSNFYDLLLGYQR